MHVRIHHTSTYTNLLLVASLKLFENAFDWTWNLALSVIVTVCVKTCLVSTCQYFEKYHFKNSIKKTSLALVLEAFTEHDNT